MFISLLKDMIIDIGKQTDEEYRARSRRILNAEARGPHGDGVCHPPIEDLPGSSPKPHTIRILWRLPCVGMISY